MYQLTTEPWCFQTLELIQIRNNGYLTTGQFAEDFFQKKSNNRPFALKHLYQDPKGHREGRMILHYGDLIDGNCLVKIISQVRPAEVYNLAAQSHVKVSWTDAASNGLRQKNFI